MQDERPRSRTLLADTRAHWPIMSPYERFDQVVAIVLSLVIAAVTSLSREFVVLDPIVSSSSRIASLAGATLVLGIVHLLLRERDDRMAE